MARRAHELEAVFFEWPPNYYETGIRAPHRYISTDHPAMPGYESERNQVLRLLESTEVKWIVTQAGASTGDWGLRCIISSRYRKVFAPAWGAVYCGLPPRSTGKVPL